MDEPSVTESEAAELLAELISFDSLNPPGREAACAEFIVEWLTDAGIDAELVLEPYPDRPQVVATIGDGDGDCDHLVLNGHIDVVPAGDRDRWSVDPFEGVVDDGRVYGRGASDMKSGLAAAMLAAREAANDRLEGTLTLTFAIGEETAEPGTKTLVSDLDADHGIVLEPTELEVQTVGKGLAWYAAQIAGEAGHASRPHTGNNAVDALLEFGECLEDYRSEIADRTHPLIGASLCTPTMVDGGTKENVLAELVELRFDRRFLPSESLADIDQEMNDLFEPIRDQGFDVTVERTRTYEAAEIPTDAPIAETVRSHAAMVAGAPTEPAGKEAATDQRNLVNDAGIPTIIWGPGTPTQAHTVDEWARIDLLVDAVDVLCRTITERCSRTENS
ncbi:M20 family metallopeptidase [Natronolimnohabitans innermongolicus]|uniref:Probable succinyl-diaminopimelate desuccinylase n=1 Tax=Natronolimnohabitans innermongolicus JCM 12255 TaxID=1227499 RepID=L9WLR4_9EURY|nr:M20 family metallopeptidase [Natronolimnohabitans innermongolicus]ELY50151.1 acetylornithine deacetylase/succinyl-diaminopimelate desuccinylase [Natronolimnohabitans innermongolicus JCM 12255]